ncbi:MAG: zinc ABC transporter substrate-binding protein, partial [Thermoguttaceae bacterium]|nr:zinc ABC transporter substrate-binding protein [Thermoguttaceae bacterium]
MKQAVTIHLVLAVVFLGCSGASEDTPGKVRAAVSVLPHAWLVEAIGGPHVEVLTLVRPGESAELYQPTDAQVSQVARASVYFRTGMPLENSRGFHALRSLGRPKVVDLREGIALRAMTPHRHSEETEGPHATGDQPDGDAAGPHDANSDVVGKDPHIWLSPRLLKIQARTIAQTLSSIDPQHAAEYQANLAGLEKRLDEADRRIRDTLGPHRGRAFFVFHPAWGYFADDYGLRQISIETEGKEPSDRELTALQNLARQERAKVIFVHPQGGTRSAQAVAQAIGAR